MIYKVGDIRLRPELVAWWRFYPPGCRLGAEPYLVVGFSMGGRALSVHGNEALELLAILDRDLGPVA